MKIVHVVGSERPAVCGSNCWRKSAAKHLMYSWDSSCGQIATARGLLKQAQAAEVVVEVEERFFHTVKRCQVQVQTIYLIELNASSKTCALNS